MAEATTRTNTPQDFFNIDVSDRVKAAEERLPPEAQERLEWHRKRGRKINGERMAIREEIKEVKEAADENERRYGATERARTKHGEADPEGEWRIPFKKARADYRRRKEQLNTNAMALAADCTGTIEDWMARQPNRHFTMAKFEVPKFDGDSFAQLQQGQGERDSQSAEVAQIEIAPRPLPEAEAAIKKRTAAFAKAGTPSVRDFFRGFSIRERTGEYRVENPGADIQFPESHTGVWLPEAEPLKLVDPVRLIAWLFPDEFEAKLLELARKSAMAGAISRVEKPALLREAKRKLLLAERIEEELALECERRGAIIPRRNPKPWVLLGIEAPAA